jgi:hypothetical protein
LIVKPVWEPWSIAQCHDFRLGPEYPLSDFVEVQVMQPFSFHENYFRFRFFCSLNGTNAPQLYFSQLDVVLFVGVVRFLRFVKMRFGDLRIF